jgi:hypothetical protein
MTVLSRLGIKRRLNLVIPGRAFERLQWLQGRTDAASHTEVIRSALFTYEILVERLAAGSTLMEKTANGALLPLPIAVDVVQPRLVGGQSVGFAPDDPRAGGAKGRRAARGSKGGIVTALQTDNAAG